MAQSPFLPHSGDALLVVDTQVDFLPGGALPVHDGDAVIAPLNRAIEHFGRVRLPIIATRDWHPPDHCSFKARGGPWPPHCVRDTPGAQFPSGLRLPADAKIVSKATERDTEAYSGFAGSELEALLRAAAVDRVFIAGLTTDYCVLQTALDARRLGFQTVVLTDTIRAVEMTGSDGARALQQMQDAGASLATTQDLEA